MQKAGELLLSNEIRVRVTWELAGKRGLVRGPKKYLKAAAKDGSALLCADGATLAIKVFGYKNSEACFKVLLARVPVFFAQTVLDWKVDKNAFSTRLCGEDGDWFVVNLPTIEMRSFLAMAKSQLDQMFVPDSSPSRFVLGVSILSLDGRSMVSVTLDHDHRLNLYADEARELGADLIKLADQIDKGPPAVAA